MTTGPAHDAPDARTDAVTTASGAGALVSETQWRRISRTGEFDHVVIGSGFWALAFAERVLRNRPKARILVLERGEAFLDDHFQNLAMPFDETLRGMAEIHPW